VKNLTPGSKRTTFDGTNLVTIVPAPAAGWTRTVIALRVTNLDTAIVTPILSKNIGGVLTEVERRAGLAVGATWKDAITLLQRMILQDTTESLSMALAGAIATVQPVAIAEWFDGEND
jgi:hypothetical protein